MSSKYLFCFEKKRIALGRDRRLLLEAFIEFSINYICRILEDYGRIMNLPIFIVNTMNLACMCMILFQLIDVSSYLPKFQE